MEFKSLLFGKSRQKLFILKVLSYWNLNAGAIGFMQLMPGLKVLSYWNLNFEDVDTKANTLA